MQEACYKLSFHLRRKPGQQKQQQPVVHVMRAAAALGVHAVISYCHVCHEVGLSPGWLATYRL